MRQVTCSKCKGVRPLRATFTCNGETYCDACLAARERPSIEGAQSSRFTLNIDGSICALCGVDHPTNADFEFRKNLPFCEKCGPRVEKWPYPSWLKLSFAGLVLLLVVSLAHGRRYFHAGHEMYLGDRLVREFKYEEAVPHLKEAVKIAPESDKAVLLLAKAALKIGDVDTAGEALQGHNGGSFENGQDAQFLEMKALWDRATAAMAKASEAVKLEQAEGKEIEAAKLYREAVAQYPESKQLASQLPYVDEGVAFAQKDYDRYLSIAQKQFAEQANATNAAALASAWACKYAATGNAESKDRAEQFLKTAQQLAQSDAEEAKSLEEYAPRIRHRIDSRQIITKQEYDRRFRGGAKGKK